MLPFGGLQCNVEFENYELNFFAPGLRKTTKNLDRVGRSQDLPDAN
jgi:hypothetical protein